MKMLLTNFLSGGALVAVYLLAWYTAERLNNDSS